MPVHHRQVRLESVQYGPPGDNREQVLANPLLEIQADGPHIADNLVPRFLERKEQTLFAPPASRFSEMRCDAGLAGPRRAADQNRGSQVLYLADQPDIQTPNPPRPAH